MLAYIRSGGRNEMSDDGFWIIGKREQISQIAARILDERLGDGEEESVLVLEAEIDGANRTARFFGNVGNFCAGIALGSEYRFRGFQQFFAGGAAALLRGG